MLRRVSALVTAGLLVGAVFSTPATGQDGGGLYEPFPEPAPSRSVREYLADIEAGGVRLASGLKDRDLERGVFVANGRRTGRQAVPEGAASTRAGQSPDVGMFDGWLWVAAGSALLTGLLLVRRRA